MRYKGVLLDDELFDKVTKDKKQTLSSFLQSKLRTIKKLDELCVSVTEAKFEVLKVGLKSLSHSNEANWS